MMFVTFEEHRAALDRIARLEGQLDTLRVAMGRILSNAKVDRDLSLVVTGNLVASRIYNALAVTVATTSENAHSPGDAAEPQR